jgi:lipopolysaccharide export system protein LptA
LKVFSLVDNPPVKKTSPTRRGKSAATKVKAEFKRDNLSADQIRAKVEKHTSKLNNNNKMTKERIEKFNAEKIPDLEDADKVTIGDVGKNDPNDLATHGKLKRVLSMGAFSFSDKEKAALEKILKD